MIRALVVLAVAVVLAGVGTTTNMLLERIGDAHGEARRAVGHALVLEARLVQLANRQAPSDPRVGVCLARTDALRQAIRALVRLERVAMPGDPGIGWIGWDAKLAERHPPERSPGS